MWFGPERIASCPIGWQFSQGCGRGAVRRAARCAAGRGCRPHSGGAGRYGLAGRRGAGRGGTGRRAGGVAGCTGRAGRTGARDRRTGGAGVCRTDPAGAGAGRCTAAGLRAGPAAAGGGGARARAAGAGVGPVGAAVALGFGGGVRGQCLCHEPRQGRACLAWIRRGRADPAAVGLGFCRHAQCALPISSRPLLRSGGSWWRWQDGRGARMSGIRPWGR